MSATRTALALAVLAALLVPAVAPPAQALSAITYDFEPGQSAASVRTDPARVGCLRLVFTATIPDPGELAMAGVYLHDGAGNPLYGLVHVRSRADGGLLHHASASVPDGVRLVHVHDAAPSGGAWDAALDGRFCFTTPQYGSWVVTAIASKGVVKARAVLMAEDGALFPRQTARGTGFALDATDFDGVVVESRSPAASGFAAGIQPLTVTGGLVGSYFSWDSASALTVSGESLVSPRWETRTCATRFVDGTCRGLAPTSGGLFFLRGGAGNYTFTALTANAAPFPGKGTHTYLFGADLRMPTATP